MKDHDIIIVTVADAEQIRHNTVAGTAEHERLFDGSHRNLRILQKDDVTDAKKYSAMHGAAHALSQAKLASDPLSGRP